MKISRKRRAKIIGTGSATPKKILSNKDLENIVDTSDEWITRRTGIKERRISILKEGESTTELATLASKRALEMAGMEPESLDLIVVGTVTSDRQFPSTACMIQNALKADNSAAFDISAGCSGFLYALSVVNNAIMCGTSKNALVIGVERLSSIINWQDRSTCVLLGDGAGAVVVTATNENYGVLSTHLRSDGTLGDLLYSSEGKSKKPLLLRDLDMKPYHLKMEGNRLFKKAVNCLYSIAEEALVENSLSSDDIHTIIPHQANIRIIEALAKKMNVSMKKIYTNLQRYGNTSSASIPIALDEANREGLLAKGGYMLLVTFGAGLTWGASVLRWCI